MKKQDLKPRQKRNRTYQYAAFRLHDSEVRMQKMRSNIFAKKYLSFIKCAKLKNKKERLFTDVLKLLF